MEITVPKLIGGQNVHGLVAGDKSAADGVLCIVGIGCGKKCRQLYKDAEKGYGQSTPTGPAS